MVKFNFGLESSTEINEQQKIIEQRADQAAAQQIKTNGAGGGAANGTGATNNGAGGGVINGTGGITNGAGGVAVGTNNNGVVTQNNNNNNQPIPAIGNPVATGKPPVKNIPQTTNPAPIPVNPAPMPAPKPVVSAPPVVNNSITFGVPSKNSSTLIQSIQPHGESISEALIESVREIKGKFKDMVKAREEGIDQLRAGKEELIIKFKKDKENIEKSIDRANKALDRDKNEFYVALTELNHLASDREAETNKAKNKAAPRNRKKIQNNNFKN
jgi:hypothetical protein